MVNDLNRVMGKLSGLSAFLNGAISASENEQAKKTYEFILKVIESTQEDLEEIL